MKMMRPHSLPILLGLLLLAQSWGFPVFNKATNSRWNPSLYVASKEAPETSSETTIQLNPLLSSVKMSKTVEVMALVKQLQADGVEVTSLSVGEPDFLPPPAVLEATHKAVTDGELRYTAVTGTLALRQAIAADLERRKGVSYDPLTEIVVGNGAKQSVYQGVLAVCGLGDQVLIPAPYWPSYPEMVALAGAKAVIVDASVETGFLLTPDQLRTTLEANPKIKLFMLCNPSNPTGGVYSRAELEGLAEVLRDYPHVAILADEIYERLVYPPTDGDIPKEDWCPSFASLPGMFDRTMTINGMSKAYAMTGYRLGYVAAPARLAKAVTTLQSQITSCAGSLSQAAGVAALTQVPDEVLEENVQIMQRKRDYVLDELAKMPYVNLPAPPRGAFYVLPDVSKAPIYNGDDTEFCLDLLKQERLALVPGSSFGAPGCIRISYATSLEELQVAMEKLNRFLTNLG
ncbi:Bifunctional aspartate aminotransferase and glutamate/aspartate-prephenate aminotransferase [Seminavis robusta]|uniref:Bifunctional aspartate aminotransferase and glutamate/aspartate-prephenate aminotransferase n=1 Tax=Seminavis robusta TaxID=568900 RepID=A0A9N8DXB7_9STRA|nr:Bifunctional aspartate aminotransferase and glutamate/aspartate-prephenate aminotransferase [Seminavis robusta]|eukprot:Sro343_g122000.1 Bifunctional aspartate aminotransferase and glutamate/aspartate-prephenate aminotransferase (459) ;mRNA; r:38190-39664